MLRLAFVRASRDCPVLDIDGSGGHRKDQVRVRPGLLDQFATAAPSNVTSLGIEVAGMCS